MSNVIQIKHGQNNPGAGVLAPYELGIVDGSKELIIGTEGDPSGILVNSAYHANTANTANTATNATNAINATQLGGVPASEYAKKTEIPSAPDLSGYATKSDLNGYATIEKLQSKTDPLIVEKANNATKATNATNATTAEKIYSPGYISARGEDSQKAFTSWTNPSSGVTEYWSNIDLSEQIFINSGISTSPYFTIQRNDSLKGRMVTAIQVEKGGTALISGSIYFNNCDISKQHGVYIYHKKSLASDYNEIASTYFAGVKAGAVSTAPVLIKFSVGDRFYLTGRSEDSTGTCSQGNAATYLNIVFLSSTNAGMS